MYTACDDATATDAVLELVYSCNPATCKRNIRVAHVSAMRLPCTARNNEKHQRLYSAGAGHQRAEVVAPTMHVCIYVRTMTGEDQEENTSPLHRGNNQIASKCSREQVQGYPIFTRLVQYYTLLSYYAQFRRHLSFWKVQTCACRCMADAIELIMHEYVCTTHAAPMHHPCTSNVPGVRAPAMRSQGTMEATLRAQGGLTSLHHPSYHRFHLCTKQFLYCKQRILNAVCKVLSKFEARNRLLRASDGQHGYQWSDTSFCSSCHVGDRRYGA